MPVRIEHVRIGATLVLTLHAAQHAVLPRRQATPYGRSGESPAEHPFIDVVDAKFQPGCDSALVEKAIRGAWNVGILRQHAEAQPLADTEAGCFKPQGFHVIGEHFEDCTVESHRRRDVPYGQIHAESLVA